MSQINTSDGSEDGVAGAKPDSTESSLNMKALISSLRSAVGTLSAGKSQISSDTAKQLQCLAHQLLEISDQSVEPNDRIQTINCYLTCAAMQIELLRAVPDGGCKLTYVSALDAFTEQHKLILQDRKSIEKMAKLRISQEYQAIGAAGRSRRTTSNAGSSTSEKSDLRQKENTAASEANSPTVKAPPTETSQPLQSSSTVKKTDAANSASTQNGAPSANYKTPANSTSKVVDAINEKSGGQSLQPHSAPQRPDSLARRLLLPIYVTILFAFCGMIMWFQIPNLITAPVARAVALAFKSPAHSRSGSVDLWITGGASLSGSITCYQNKPPEETAER